MTKCSRQLKEMCDLSAKCGRGGGVRNVSARLLCRGQKQTWKAWYILLLTKFAVIQRTKLKQENGTKSSKLYKPSKVSSQHTARIARSKPHNKTFEIEKAKLGTWSMFMCKRSFELFHVCLIMIKNMYVFDCNENNGDVENALVIEVHGFLKMNVGHEKPI